MVLAKQVKLQLQMVKVQIKTVGRKEIRRLTYFAGSTFGGNGAFEMDSNFSGADSNSQEGGFGGGSGFDFSGGAAFGSDGADCFGSGEGTDFGKSNPFAGDGEFSSAESPFGSSFGGFQF